MDCFDYSKFQEFDSGSNIFINGRLVQHLCFTSTSAAVNLEFH